MATQTLTPAAVEHGEQCFVLSPVQWWQYETVLRAFPEQPGLRVTYIDGRLTLVSPSRRHDWHEKALGHIVAAVAAGLGIEWEPAGHTTYRREGAGGVEGDDAYYLGANAERMRGPVDVDLTTQPPPDLVIEVEATHRADDAVDVWGRLGVTEVWRLDVNRGSLTFGLLRPDGTYAPAARSAGLAPLTPEDVLGQVRLAERLGSSRWYAQLDGWVRGTLLPRRGG